MTKQINTSGTIEGRLPICPSCKDTKYIISQDLVCIKLSIDPEARLHCTKCNLEWDMQMTSFSSIRGGNV
jgi:hypothetical protein